MVISHRLEEFSSHESQFLKDHGVAAVYLFGSQAQGTASKASDFDVALLSEDPRGVPDRNMHHKIYDFVYDMIEPKLGRLANIDIVFLHEASLQLQYHVIRSGRVIWESNPKCRADYHEKIMEAHADFAPHREVFQAATLARI